jgi:TM2 domain-containing membrane protein YozV
MTIAISNRKLLLSIFLDMLLAGVGHMYIHRVRRGIVILLSAISIGVIINLIVPYPFSLIAAMAFWLWQIYDLIRITKNENKRSFVKAAAMHSRSDIQNPCIKCGNSNPDGSAFCNKCGAVLR